MSTSAPVGTTAHIPDIPTRQHLLLAGMIGLFVAVLCYPIRTHTENVGDFAWALSTAKALLQGRDPYDFVPDNLHVPYPLPVALFGLPLVWLPWPLAAAIFVGFSSGLLAWGILRSEQSWRLWVFASFPFVTVLFFRQWSALIMAAWFVPALAPTLVLIKPQVALPIALLRLTRRGVIAACAVLLASLILDPTWPARWLAMLGPYERVIPLMQLPFGPLLLLAALRWRDPRARMLLLMAVLPIRGLYDLCPLWLIPETRRQASRLALASWLMYPLMLLGMKTAVFVIPVLYIPALLIVLRPWLARQWQRFHQ
jgi:hypothetical protein